MDNVDARRKRQVMVRLAGRTARVYMGRMDNETNETKRMTGKPRLSGGMPELLAPAGNREKLETCVAYGADAVYLGGPGLNLRAPQAGFGWEDLPGAASYAGAHGLRVYFCLNAFPRQTHMDMVREFVARLGGLRVDGVIVADPGVFRIVRKELPDLPIHVSTQANTGNSEAALFWQDLGARRVNLARELSLRDIRRIAREIGVRRQGVGHGPQAGAGPEPFLEQALEPPLELEVFVHGAMCLALSGRCLLSAHLTGRSANLGMCTHPCRYDYKPVAVAFEERTRPGETLWEVAGTAGAAGPEGMTGENREGGFSALFSPDDVCLVKYLAWLWRVGVASLKIEGRMKSGGYLAQVLDVYRTALDDLAGQPDTAGQSCQEGQPCQPIQPAQTVQHGRRFRTRDYLGELANAASRELTSGFFLPGPAGEAGKVKYGAKDMPKRPILARILRQEGEGRWRVAVRGAWDTARDAEILVPGLGRPVLRAGEYGLETDLGERRSSAHSGTELILRSDAPELKEHLFLRAK